MTPTKALAALSQSRHIQSQATRNRLRTAYEFRPNKHPAKRRGSK